MNFRISVTVVNTPSGTVIHSSSLPSRLITKYIRSVGYAINTNIGKILYTNFKAYNRIFFEVINDLIFLYCSSLYILFVSFLNRTVAEHTCDVCYVDCFIRNVLIKIKIACHIVRTCFVGGIEVGRCKFITVVT